MDKIGPVSSLNFMNLISEFTDFISKNKSDDDILSESSDEENNNDSIKIKGLMENIINSNDKKTTNDDDKDDDNEEEGEYILSFDKTDNKILKEDDEDNLSFY